MKIGPKQLGQLIGAIVREELKRQLPGLVKECLTERYLKNIVAEQGHVMTRAISRKKPGLAEALGEEDEDEIPGPMNNSDQGIYKVNSMAKGSDEEEQRKARLRPNEMVSKLLASNNPLSSLFEGVTELSRAEANANPGVPIEKMGGDFGKMRELLQGMERNSVNKRGVSTAPAEERKFDPKLDTPLGGQAAPRPRPRPMAETAQRFHPNIEGEVFPSAPIVLEE